MKKKYVVPEVEIHTALAEQSFMSLSTVKFDDVTNGGTNTDDNGVLPSDNPTDDEWGEIGWD